MGRWNKLAEEGPQTGMSDSRSSRLCFCSAAGFVVSVFPLLNGFARCVSFGEDDFQALFRIWNFRFFLDRHVSEEDDIISSAARSLFRVRSRHGSRLLANSDLCLSNPRATAAVADLFLRYTLDVNMCFLLHPPVHASCTPSSDERKNVRGVAREHR